MEPLMDNRFLRVEMPDGSKWDIPVMIIARDRAGHYASEFDGDIEKSLHEDTLLLFADDDYEIEDWASNNMDWEDVKDHAVKVSDRQMTDRDFQEGWVNGEKEVISKEDGDTYNESPTT